MKLHVELLLLIACGLGLSGPPGAQPRQQRDVALVANPDVPVDNLTLYEARHIFMGDKQYWKRNLPVVLLVPSSGTHEYDVMLRTLYRMNPSEYSHYWSVRIVSAQPISPPKTVESSELANELATNMQGCIAMVNADHILQGSKVIRVNGLLPGQKGYPLR